MTNQLLNLAIAELRRKKYDAYFMSISNQNLYEFTREIDNYVVDLTGFTGDSGAILVTRDKCYLYVDGRFTIQAKKEINDKRIKVIETNRNNKRLDDILNRIKVHSKVAINPKNESTSNVLATIEAFKKKKSTLVFDYGFLKREFKERKKNCFNLTSAPLFLLDEKYVSENSKTKIRDCIESLKESCNVKSDIHYVTSSLEEIAFLTNLRYRFCDIHDRNVLFDAFLIVGSNESILYTNDYLEEKAQKYIEKSGIIVKRYDDFYTDIKKIKNKNKYFFDKKLNNYHIYKCLHCKNDENIIETPLLFLMSQKGEVEISNLRKVNVLDGVAMTKVLYKLKCGDLKKNNLNDEYKIKCYVDETRRKVGGKNYLCPSFETIVAFKENAAICHYLPKRQCCKKVTNNSVLLIDSGGNYLGGTTDVTRTISLYKSKVPDILKKHYTMILDSMISLSITKFPYGLTGFEIDIIARKKLYDEYYDYNHGTGHGIGYVSNVHEGPNRIGPGITKLYEVNTMEINQVSSNEPGLYFENKYGIRIENDILTRELKENEYGTFLGFETLTLCPFDRDLIDKKYMEKKNIDFLNEYNRFIYKKLSKYLSNDEKKWLEKETRRI